MLATLRQRVDCSLPKVNARLTAVLLCNRPSSFRRAILRYGISIVSTSSGSASVSSTGAGGVAET